MIDVRSRGATGDGKTLDTKPLQAAIDSCAEGGGGVVRLPAGDYLTGSLSLRSDVTLHLEPGAVLRGSQDPKDYPLADLRWEGVTRRTHAPLVGGQGLRNVAIIGQGKIDGQGAAWWKRHREGSLSHPRPRLISFTDCSGVLVRGIVAVDSPSWTIHPVRCDNVMLSEIRIINPPDSPNTDGIDPDSCTRVFISDCFVSVGDDCIAVKAGAEGEAPELRSPCRGIVISNCILEKGHGGVVIGSESSGGVHDVVISNCIFSGTDRGIRLKSRRGRGGVVEDVRVSNVTMRDVLCPFTVNLHYACGAWGDPVVSDRGLRPPDPGTPRFRGISLSDVHARGTSCAAAYIHGLAEMPVEDIVMREVTVSLEGESESYPEMADGLQLMSREGFFARYVKGLSMDGVRVDGQRGHAFHIEDSSGVILRACGTKTPVAGVETVRLMRVSED